MRAQLLFLAASFCLVPVAPLGAIEPLPQPEAGVASVRQIMLAITIPASDAVFAADAEALKTQADWDRLEAEAMALAESGRLLRTGGRAPAEGGWTGYATMLTDTSLAAAAAAREKDADKALDAGNAIYETCDGCHAVYMPGREGE